MQILRRTLITTLIIFSIAVLVERKAWINVAKAPMPVLHEPASAILNSYSLRPDFQFQKINTDLVLQRHNSQARMASFKSEPIRRKASRKKTASAIS